MKNNITFAAALLAVSGTLYAGDATAPYLDTRINAKLNLEVKPDTEVLHFIRDNADPFVVTKTYVLKHADPYEIRKYLREIVQTRRVEASDSGIQAIKYNDGTGIVMVSAEDYRFADSENGQGIDSIVETLDKPKVISSGGKPTYVYSPKFRPAEELALMVRASGANVSGDVIENIAGTDKIACDPALNLMVFKTSQFSRKNIDTVLKEYDRPYPEVKAKITVYEIYAENDTKLGLDFQAWKNNEGVDLLSGGARFMQNYAPDGSNLVKGTGWSDTKYFNFNPKWNTKYIDFLTSKGKAKIMHSCELVVRNRTTAEIDRLNSVFLATVEPAEAAVFTESYVYVPDSTPGTDFDLTAFTTAGKQISISAAGTVTLTVLKMAAPSGVGAEKYTMTLEGGVFTVDGKSVGTKFNAASAEVYDLTGDPDNPSLIEYTSNDVVALKGNKVKTTASGDFGFRMSITPSITDKATILDVSVSNSSLIGYKSSGEARIQESANVESSFMISNEGTKLVIGGLEKRDVVSVSGGIPILKDLPILGWLFSTESESTKKSQLLVVAEVVPVRPGDALDSAIADDVKAIEGKLQKAGESNTFGYRQFLLDSDRLK
ncbi:MAG: type II and III secretion system protein [Victivallales bacterium]|jgi:type II secretory pathway component GspD/PulD (secretin)|nr:type II and III secretion system protein [Victivallales bacterium]